MLLNLPFVVPRASAPLLAVLLALASALTIAAPSPVHASSHVWINEIHYDNAGTDRDEAIEVAGVAGTDLTGWSLVLYNGDGGEAYRTTGLSGILPDQQAGFGTTSVGYPVNGIQNGPEDGIALVDAAGEVVQFLSYEGTLVGVGGPADGMTSEEIGSEQASSSPVGHSLQLAGNGASYGDFDWALAAATFGEPNTGQTMGAGFVVAGCGEDVSTREGLAASNVVTATDADGVVTAISVSNVDPMPESGSITVTSFSPAMAPGGTAQATVTADGSVPVGTYTVTMEASNADAPPQTDSCTFDFTVYRPTEIAEIQGRGHTSPLRHQGVFDVQGVVTAIRPEDDDPVGGFWIHDPTPDANPDTSEGVFVYTGSTPAVMIGDLVRVDGTVTEFRPFFEEPTITEITDATWTVESSGNALPFVTVGTAPHVPPTTIIDNDAPGNIERGGSYDPTTDGIDFWETLEGMRVAVADPHVVGPTNNFGEVTVVSGAAPAGEFTPRGGLIVRKLTSEDYAGEHRPGDFNPERLIIDDEFVAPPQLNVGDEFAADPVGVMDFSFGAYKLLLTQPVAGVDKGLEREVAAPVGPRELSVATFNVENLSAQDDAEKVDALANQIVNHLRSPDLIAIEEMQDNSGFANDGTVAADQSWQMLIDAIVAAGGPTYDYRQIDPLNNADGGAPGSNIRVGFLFHSERGLEFVDRPGGTAEGDTGVVPTPNGKGAQLTLSPGRVLETPDGMENAWFETRKSLAGEFHFRGETIFVVANHFSSKNDDNPLYSQFQPPTRWTEFQSVNRDEDGWRHAQAQTINNFADEIFAVDPGAHVIVLGDINDFDFSETVGVLSGELVAELGGPDADGSGPTSAGDGRVLTTLFDGLPDNEKYSYVFEGNSQVLDQILVSSSLIDLHPAYDVVHVNAEFAEQASDHDPSLMRVAFQPRGSGR